MKKTTLLSITIFFAVLKISAQKIVLQLDATPATTPSVSKATLRYNKDFAYSFTFDDCFAEHYTMAKPFYIGGAIPGTAYTSPGFFFTDGCGNDVNFKPGIAWNSTNTSGAGPNEHGPSYMSWAQLQEVYNMGWDVINHSFAHRSLGEITGSYTYANQISQNADAVRSHLGIEMPCFVSPNSDVGYNDVAFQLGLEAVFNGNFSSADFSSISFNGIPVDGTVNTNDFKAIRNDLNVELYNNPTLLSKVADKSTGGAHYWYNEFTHHINGSDANLTFNQFKDYMLNIANTYGKNGSDRVWFAPLQEVYEYIVSRQNTNFSTNLTNDNKLEITLDLASVPTWMRRKTLSLIVNSTANFSNVTLPQGITATWRGTGTTKLLNLDFTNYITVIPVELLAFSAKTQGTSGLLAWKTASENGFQGFEIERSLDGKDYVPMGFVKAKGTGSEYTFEDNSFQKTSYYRLKMLNTDGSFEYSKIVSLFVESKYTIKITPSVANENVNVETDFDDKTPATINIFNQSGQLILTQVANKTNSISIESLPQGLYFVRVNHGLDFWVKKVTKW